MRRKLNWLVFILSAGLAGALWYYTGQLLYPSWRAKDLSVCDARTESYWGKDCGNIRKSGQFQFEEIKIPSTNGYDLPGWKIPSAKNGSGPASGAVFLVHGGGSDRREESRYIQFFVSRRLDVYTFDMSCSGESPCVAAGMTFGHKESRDVQSVYAQLSDLLFAGSICCVVRAPLWRFRSHSWNLRSIFDRRIPYCGRPRSVCSVF
ncbi:MAG TPA: hypothetical protein PLW55_07095 [Leptospiraceae bacterium]|nr:hypothetical protein [Leptospiraceae bacterium]